MKYQIKFSDTKSNKLIAITSFQEKIKENFFISKYEVFFFFQTIFQKKTLKHELKRTSYFIQMSFLLGRDM